MWSIPGRDHLRGPRFGQISRLAWRGGHHREEARHAAGITSPSWPESPEGSTRKSSMAPLGPNVLLLWSPPFTALGINKCMIIGWVDESLFNDPSLHSTKMDIIEFTACVFVCLSSETLTFPLKRGSIKSINCDLSNCICMLIKRPIRPVTSWESTWGQCWGETACTKV